MAITGQTVIACDPLVRPPTQIVLHLVCGCACHSFFLSFVLALSLSPTTKKTTINTQPDAGTMNLLLAYCCPCTLIDVAFVIS